MIEKEVCHVGDVMALFQGIDRKMKLVNLRWNDVRKFLTFLGLDHLWVSD